VYGQEQYLRFQRDAAYERETNYYLIYMLDESDSYVSDHGNTVRVVRKDEEGFNLRLVVLDQLIHSRVRGRYVEREGKSFWETDVSYMGYGHEQVQAEFARAAAADHAEPHLLVI